MGPRKVNLGIDGEEGEEGVIECLGEGKLL